MTSAKVDPVPSKKGKNRKALKPKNPSANEANILASNPSPLPSFAEAGKENQGLALILSPNKTKKISKETMPNEAKQAFTEELREMQGKLEQIRLEKEKTEELLKERDELLKRKEEELENRGKEQEKLQMELKKWQKLKEFKPTMKISLVQSLREKEQEMKDKKKKACLELKKPSPAYILWSKDQWNEVKKENPDALFKEISHILGEKWKKLSEEEKKPYEERYKADKETYLLIVGKEKREKEALKLLEEEQKQKIAIELLEQYLEFKKEADKETKKTRKERDPLKPKKPISAFFLYYNERRASLLADTNNVKEISKLVGEEWNKMTEEKRAPYEEIARKHKEEYLQKIELYKQKKEQKAASLQKEEEEQMKIQKEEALRLLKKKEKTENIIKKTKEKKKKQKEDRHVDPNKPKKPATSFFLFSKETRKELLHERPNISNATLRALISVKWKELDESARKMWNEKAAEPLAAYKKEMEEYKKMAVTISSTTSHHDGQP